MIEYRVCGSDMVDGERGSAVYSAIRAVLALHSKGYAWLDVKPANFVFNPDARTFVAIDLEGARSWHDTVSESAQVASFSGLTIG